jgi:hypothetical protein
VTTEPEEDALLILLPGETREQAIIRWWDKHGLDAVKAQADRKVTYARQKAEADQLRAGGHA